MRMVLLHQDIYIGPKKTLDTALKHVAGPYILYVNIDFKKPSAASHALVQVVASVRD